MAIARVQGNSAGNVATDVTIAAAFAGNTITGNLIYVAVTYGVNPDTTVSVADGGVNTYTQIGTNEWDATKHQGIAQFYAKNITGAATPTITATFGVTCTFRGISIQEYSGLDKTAPLDVSATNQGTSTTAADNATSTAATPTKHGELIVGSCCDTDGTDTPNSGTGFIQRSRDTTIFMTVEDKIQVIAASIAATFTTAVTGGRYVAKMATFKNAVQYPYTLSTVRPLVRATSYVNNSIFGTVLTRSSSTADSATFNTASITPTANDLIIAYIINGTSGAGPPDTGTLTGNGLTWVNVATLQVGSIHLMSVWRANGAAPSSGTVGIRFNGATQAGCGWNISWFRNCWFTSGDNGSSSIIQFQTSIGTAVTSGTVILNSFGTAGSWNGIYSCWGGQVNQNLAVETGYTRIGTGGFATPNTSHMVMWKSVGGDINPSASWSSAMTFGGISLELKSKVQIHSRPLQVLIQTIKASASRIGQYIRKISLVRTLSSVVSQIKVTGGATVRTISLILSRGIKVSRLQRYLRPLFLVRSQTSSVSRLRRLIRNISLVRGLTSLVVRYRNIRLTISLLRSQSSSVRRIGYYIRKISAIISFKAIVSRIGRYIRTISLVRPITSVVTALKRLVRIVILIRPQSSLVSMLRRLVRNISLIIKQSSLVSRIARYLRTVSLKILQTSVVQRLRRLIRTISLSLSIKAIVNKASAFARNVVLVIKQTSQVSRLGRYVRRIIANLSIKTTVSRIGYYIRRVNLLRSILATVSRSIVAGIVARTLVLIRPATSKVSRIGRYIRTVSLIIKATSLVQRIARYLRRVTTIIKATSSVARLALRVRTLVVLRGMTSAVRRSSWYIRTISLIRSTNSMSVKRIGRYLRNVLLTIRLGALVVRFMNLGEAILLKVETLLREKIKFTSGANEIAKYRALLAEKIRYKN